MRSSGSGSMITPVENGSTCCGATFRCRARATQVARARTRPSSPVPALALPVLITSARMSPPATCSRHTCTGAAQKRLRVNTAPTLAPGSSRKTVRSLRLALRTPASATPMLRPRMGRRSVALGAFRLTGMESPVERSVLAPRKSAQAPAALASAVTLGICVAFEALEDVVGLDAQLGRALGSGDGAHAAATQQDGLPAAGHRL